MVCCGLVGCHVMWFDMVWCGIKITYFFIFQRDASCVDALTLCEDVSMENAEVDVEVV